MGKIGWASAMIHSTRVSNRRAPPIKDIPIREAVRIETEDMRWIAVCVEAGCELKVVDALMGLGYQSYCPLGAKFKFWSEGPRRSPRKFVRQHPVFSRYIFVGLMPGRVLSRTADDRITAILGDARGPIFMPATAVRAINDLELAYHWDETRSWREKSPFQPGSQALIKDGPFAGIYATVDKLESESKISVLVSLFGRLTPLELSPCQIDAA